MGRAGRGIDSAVGILLCGSEDRAIHKFFRESAFPAEAQIHEILNVLSVNDGLTLRGIEQRTNLRYGQIEKALKLLVAENPSPVVYTEKLWRRTIVSFSPDHERINHLMNQRKSELADVESYITTKECKMQFLRRALDEPVPNIVVNVAVVFSIRCCRPTLIAAYSMRQTYLLNTLTCH
ncbi:hypothetical protein EB564_0017030 [Escherichia coli]|nr:hypothetical protein [Escherichia coli]